jgi:hypothetical protein
MGKDVWEGSKSLPPVELLTESFREFKEKRDILSLRT